MSYSSTKAMANTLAWGLADQPEPTVCPDCLRNFSSRFLEDTENELQEHVSRLRVDCHALFDACIATLTTPRTAEELERLALALAANRRQCSIHRLASRPFRAEEYLGSLTSSAADLFTTAVRVGDNAFMDRVEKANKTFGDKKGRWPARVEQLFPGGVPATVDALLSYSEQYISAGPLCMLGEMVNVARPVIMPVLEQDPFRARLVNIVLKMLDPAASQTTARTTWTFGGKPSYSLPCHVLSVLSDGAGARPDDGSRFFAGHHAVLLRLLSHVADRMEDTDLMFPWLAKFSLELADHCGDPVPAGVDRWFDAPGRCRCRKQVTAQTVHTLILMTKSQRVCAGPSCSLSIFQKEDGKPFQACARCRVPRYCSRACQLADWRGAPPHKDLCTVFCTLKAHECVRGNLPEFEAAFAGAEPLFSEADRQALHAFVSSDCEHSRSSAHA